MSDLKCMNGTQRYTAEALLLAYIFGASVLHDRFHRTSRSDHIYTYRQDRAVRKSRKPNIIIHMIETNSEILRNKISDLYIEVIRRNLLDDKFTQKQKLDIVDGIIAKKETDKVKSKISQ